MVRALGALLTMGNDSVNRAGKYYSAAVTEYVGPDTDVTAVGHVGGERLTTGQVRHLRMI